MTSCLSCEELAQRICDLETEISSASGCEGVNIREDDTSFDYSKRTDSKNSALGKLIDLYSAMCASAGSMDLYEFVHVPCVKPANCEGTGCLTVPRSRQNRRRYRR